MTGAAGLHGFLLAQNALEFLACVNLGVEDLAGLCCHIGGEAAAALVALLAGGLNLVGVAPLGHGDVAEDGASHIARNIALDTHCLGRLVDGQFGNFVPPVQLVHHGGTLVPAPEEGIGSSSAVECTADCSPIGDAALVGFEHSEGEGIVGSAVLLGHEADQAIEAAVATGVALVPVAFVGHCSDFLGIKLVGLPAELAVHLRETFRGSLGILGRCLVYHAQKSRTGCDTAKT